MLINHVDYRLVRPSEKLSDFVESFWMLHNTSDQPKQVVIVPDGRIDVFFLWSDTIPYRVVLRGLDNEPDISTIAAKTTVFAVSLTLLAVEYLLDKRVASLLNGGAPLPADFWGIVAEDLNDFDLFCEKITQRITSSLKGEIDQRKRKLFALLYSSNGAISVRELADAVQWSSRQINRYFTQWFGLSLKTYCTILRFRASFKHLSEGKLYPEQNFADQAHFIREVKKYAGVVPKELSKNPDDRFIQFSALP